MSSKNEKSVGFLESFIADQKRVEDDILPREFASKDDRRGFLKKSSILALFAMVGSNVPFARNFPSGILPAAIANENFSIKGKSGLIYHNDRPITAETLPKYFKDEFVKPENFFIRLNGLMPDESLLDPKGWTLRVEGESCEKPTTFTLDELKTKFKHYTYALTLECGGNGRKEVIPATSGTQWGVGAVACGRWTGVRLRDVLQSCGIRKDAVYIGYEGVDIPLNGDESKKPISRGVPIKKALEDETLIAWSYEGVDIPTANGYPLRLVAGGYPASASGKWLNKILVRNIVHDGEKMIGSYTIPLYPVEPGAKLDKDAPTKIIENMPVKSVIAYPQSRAKFKPNEKIKVGGKAWADDLEVKEMELSTDFGQTWQKAEVKKPLNKFAWQEWSGEVELKSQGYYEIWARATDSNGVKQPMVLPAWNPKGYLNNSCHRIAVFIG